MPKKKSAKKTDQPELPLDAAATVPVQTDKEQSTNGDAAPVAAGENGGQAPADPQDAAAEAAPKRKPG